MDAKISEKLLPKKSFKNTVLSARLRAEKSIKNKSKFYQKSLTQAWDFFEFLECKRLLFDTFSGSRLREIFKLLKENTLIFDKSSTRLTFLFTFPTRRERGRKRVIKAYIPQVWNHRTKM